jgi:chromosome segregation ATPase
MSEKKIEGLKVDNKVLEEESQSLERKCNTLELEVEVFREWKRKRDMELDTLQKDVKIFDAEKKSLIVQCDEIKMREHSLLARVQGLIDTKQKLNDSEAEQAREMEVHRKEILNLESEICGFKNDREEYRVTAERFQREKGELENEISRLKSKIKNIKAECDTDDEENLRSAKSSRTAQSAKRSSISQGPRAKGYVTPETPRNFSTSSSGDGRQARRVDSEVRIVDGHQQNFY